MNNLCTCVSNKGDTLIVDGKKLKSYNKWANDEFIRLEKIKAKQNIKATTKKQAKIWSKRNRQINDYYNKAVKILINYCIDHHIGKIVVGYNKTTNKSNFQEKNYSEKFVNLPMKNFKNKLEHKCKIYNIDFIKQEESYTSKSDFLSDDILPTINVQNPKEYKFMGERISRGQYKSFTNKVINADINAALNIQKKVDLVDIIKLKSTKIKQPQRIKVS